MNRLAGRMPQDAASEPTRMYLRRPGVLSPTAEPGTQTKSDALNTATQMPAREAVGEQVSRAYAAGRGIRAYTDVFTASRRSKPGTRTYSGALTYYSSSVIASALS